MANFRDTYINGGDIGLLTFDRMLEQLMYAESIEACIAVVEPYFMRRALDERPMISTVTSHIAKKLILGRGAGSIIGLAKEHYLLLRQMERNFIREIGVSPKSYACTDFCICSLIKHANPRSVGQNWRISMGILIKCT